MSTKKSKTTKIIKKKNNNKTKIMEKKYEKRFVYLA